MRGHSYLRRGISIKSRQPAPILCHRHGHAIDGQSRNSARQNTAQAAPLARRTHNLKVRQMRQGG
jgi:hypothetical protein